MEFLNLSRGRGELRKPSAVLDLCGKDRDGASWAELIKLAITDGGLSECEIRDRLDVSVSTLAGWREGAFDVHPSARQKILRALEELVRSK